MDLCDLCGEIIFEPRMVTNEHKYNISREGAKAQRNINILAGFDILVWEFEKTLF